MLIKFSYILGLFLLFNITFNNETNPIGAFSIARIHYDGGGDWYSDKSSIPNLLAFVSENTSIITKQNQDIVKIGDNNFYSHSYFYITGHGNIDLSDNEVIILREHLINGAFLHVDDNYGLDESFRREIKKVFPKKNLIEIPFNHPIFSSYFIFKNGLPKIHEHDNKPPTAFGLFDSNRLILVYTFETDLGDGWEDASVHNNSDIKRTETLKMGVKNLTYTLIQ